MASALSPSHGALHHADAPPATVGARVLALVREFPGIKRDAVNKAIAGASGAVRAFLLGGRLTEINDRLFLPTHDPTTLTERRTPRELIIEMVTQNPGTSRNAIHDLTAEGTRVANLLVHEGRLVRRGQNFYLPEDAPPLSENGTPDPNHEVATTIRTSPGLTLSALRERHPTISDINAVLRNLCHRHVARRVDSAEGYRWHPLTQTEARTEPRDPRTTAPKPTSPLSAHEPESAWTRAIIEDALTPTEAEQFPIAVTAPAPTPEAGQLETDLMPEAKPMTTTQDTPQRTTRTKSTPPRLDPSPGRRNAVLDAVNRHPEGTTTTKLDEELGRTTASALLHLTNQRKIVRKGTRGTYVYFPLHKAHDATPAPTATRSKRAKPSPRARSTTKGPPPATRTSPRPSSELMALREHEANLLALQELEEKLEAARKKVTASRARLARGRTSE